MIMFSKSSDNENLYQFQHDTDITKKDFSLGAWLLYNVVLVSAVQQSESVILTHILDFLSN